MLHLGHVIVILSVVYLIEHTGSTMGDVTLQIKENNDVNNTSRIPRCKLPMDDGYCRAIHYRWWYNYTSNTCTKFIYGGCYGNRNRFISQEDCEKRCKKPRKSKSGRAKNVTSLR
uniref:Bpti/kunitz family of serine protease inhibitor n=1 Tax=Rhipicephalus zambeziensis TaxID=60191 RepID=A0A224YDB3_9ACAR